MQVFNIKYKQREKGGKMSYGQKRKAAKIMGSKKVPYRYISRGKRHKRCLRSSANIGMSLEEEI